MPYGIYGQRLGRASADALKQAVSRLEDAPLTNLIAMVAPQGSGRYAAEDIRDVVITATTAFAAARAESTRRVLRIHTGHWGTGAFGGNRVLMAAAQVLAARIAGVDELAYHSLGDDAVRAFEEGGASRRRSKRALRSTRWSGCSMPRVRVGKVRRQLRIHHVCCRDESERSQRRRATRRPGTT